MFKKFVSMFLSFLLLGQNIVLGNKEEQNKPEKTASQYIDDVDEMLADSYGYYVVEIKRGDRTYRIPYVTRKQRKLENIFFSCLISGSLALIFVGLNGPYQGSYAQQGVNWTRESFDSLLHFLS